MHPKTPKLLLDIEQACAFIFEDIASETLDSYLQDRRTRQVVERNFTIIGEALSRLRRADPTVAARLTDFHRIVGLRNRLAHGYDEEIDDTLVWRTAQESLILLRAEIAQLLREADDEGLLIK